MASEAEVLEQVKGIVTNCLGVEADKVTLEANFETDLGADDMDLAELVLQFEQQFGITITREALDSMDTVGGAVSYIAAQ
ncbi:MAG TPA: acyl carrier protein [Anaerolineae bacterium]|nr:acyl carrier protein [Anaerolineae bacterium]